MISIERKAQYILKITINFSGAMRPMKPEFSFSEDPDSER
jgi:hypothetical protein